MKRILMIAAASASAATGAAAGGIDRSGQPIGIIFKEGNYLEFGVSRTSPSVGGSDLAQSPPGFPFPFDSGASYDNVADAFTSVSFGLKYDLNDKITLAVIGAEDFGSDISYGGDPMSTLLAGTEAIADTYTLGLLGRYRFNENVSLHTGLRAQWARGNIKLNGLAYGGPTLIDPATGAPVRLGASGYEVDLGEDVGYGYLIGGAYEIPEYALRVAITYFSPIEHSFKTTETLPFALAGVPGSGFTTTSGSARTDVRTPEAVNFDFQTGVAADTLIFGGIRWADWSEFSIKPEQLGRNLVEIEDTTTYTIGVGRRFTENFAASASFIYEAEQSDDLVSPLAPTNGLKAIAIGGAYRIDQIEFSAGIRYTWLGDAEPETGTPDVARADFSSNDAVSVGVRVGYYF